MYYSYKCVNGSLFTLVIKMTLICLTSTYLLFANNEGINTNDVLRRYIDDYICELTLALFGM